MLKIESLVGKVLNPDKHWKMVLLNEWQSIVGALHTRIRVERIQDDNLIIGVYESHWMQELFMLSRVILQSIHTRIGPEHIKQVRFKLVELKKKPVKKYVKSVTQCVQTELTESQKRALASIKDEQLVTALKAFLIKCKEQ